ncbi:indole-3-glycerol phosphate synthase TrpC [Fictibacillus iocasae]|uniref:Indole-3-glycerol phosphate synthase n=1 Tax=Fictibacillus iocasae TaxID=2715437 RepID=A0ABW2NIL7_9BACL
MLLTEILKRKNDEIEALKRKDRHATNETKRRGFAAALRNNSSSPALIAEVKKASPSKGIIRQNFDPVQIAKDYEKSGAACLSVLTDEQFFQGSLNYLKEIRKFTSIPLLRKDFIIDEAQIEESLHYGADAILLIAAAMPASRLRCLHERAERAGLDVLVEVHSAQELKTITAELSPTLIGINNRNLNTFHTDLNTTFELRPLIPPDSIIVSESGIRSFEDVQKLQSAGIDAMLVGETLMRSPDVCEAVRRLYGRY